jgi:pyruvate formate lyase activating enzyme
MSNSPLILEIKGNSLDDGPGIRTVVFFKGCPLSCLWCHNPESKTTGVEISFDRKECIGCGTCIESCPLSAVSKDNPDHIDRSKCNLCMICADKCPARAITAVGKSMSMDEVIEVIKKDIPFYKTSGGGVTLSGGEPAMFIEYTSELLRKLRAIGVHTLIETSGYFKFEEFNNKLYPYLDTIYMDLKIMDPKEHEKSCGVSNAKILENFSTLYKSFLEGGVRLLPRVHLIPGITAVEDNLKSIALFLKDNKASEVALLQYNPLWTEKSEKIGKSSSYGEKNWISQSDLKKFESIFTELQIKVI